MHLPTTILTILLSLLPTIHAKITCLRPHPLHPPIISPADCTNAITLLRIGDKTHAPMHFSRHHDTGFALPHRWHSGSCVVAMDMQSEDDEDDFPIEDVALAAEAIVTQCVLGGTGYGGLVLVGPRKVVDVSVYGRKVLGEGWGVEVGGRNVSADMLATARGGTAVARGFRA